MTFELTRFSTFPPYVLKRNTLLFGDRIGLLLQARFFFCRLLDDYLHSNTTLINVRFVNTTYFKLDANIV